MDVEKALPNLDSEPEEIPDYILVPLLIAPDEIYTKHQLGTPITRLDGFPTAHIDAENEEDINSVSIALADNSNFTNGEEISFRILSSIRYEFKDGRIVYVSTTLPSPAAIDSVLSFDGNATVLKTQGEAWLDQNVDLDETPSSINFIKDNLIITVTGNVAVEELLSIADELIYK